MRLLALRNLEKRKLLLIFFSERGNKYAYVPAREQLFPPLRQLGGVQAQVLRRHSPLHRPPPALLALVLLPRGPEGLPQPLPPRLLPLPRKVLRVDLLQHAERGGGLLAVLGVEALADRRLGQAGLLLLLLGFFENKIFWKSRISPKKV